MEISFFEICYCMNAVAFNSSFVASLQDVKKENGTIATGGIASLNPRLISGHPSGMNKRNFLSNNNLSFWRDFNAPIDSSHTLMLLWIQ